MTVALMPPALNRDRFCTIEEADEVSGLVKFSGIDNLDAAEGIAGCFVLASTDELELDTFDVAFDDLLDREVIDGRYGSLGTIQEVLETPANDVWVIDGSTYGEVLIPVIDQVIAEIPEEGPIAVTIMDGIIDAPAAAGGDSTCS